MRGRLAGGAVLLWAATLPFPQVVGFYTAPEPGLGLSRASMVQHAGMLRQVDVFFFHLMVGGSGRVGLLSGVTRNEVRATVRLARSLGLRVEGVVSNLEYGTLGTNPSVAGAVLTRPEARRMLVDSLVALVRQDGLNGINLDLEGLPSSLRSSLTLLVQQAAAALHRWGATLTVDVMPKTWSWQPGAGVYDYRRLGQVADGVVLMTYGQHDPSGPPGPVVSLPWAEAQVRYAVTRVPAGRLLLGVPAYAYAWGPGVPVYFGSNQVAALARAWHVPVRFDAQAVSPYVERLVPGGTDEVWFEDARTFAALGSLARAYRLGGVAVWRLGLEAPGSMRALWCALQGRADPTSGGCGLSP